MRLRPNRSPGDSRYLYQRLGEKPQHTDAKDITTQGRRAWDIGLGCEFPNYFVQRRLKYSSSSLTQAGLIRSTFSIEGSSDAGQPIKDIYPLNLMITVTSPTFTDASSVIPNIAPSRPCSIDLLR